MRTNLTSGVVESQITKIMCICIRNRGSHFENDLYATGIFGFGGVELVKTLFAKKEYDMLLNL